MLTFISVALLIYGSMHLYALSKVWLAFPHSAGLGATLTVLGLLLTFSPVLLWNITRLNWHGLTVAASWLTYSWMGFLFLFCAIALVFDFGHVLAALLGLRWHLNGSMTLLSIGVLAVSMLGYGFIEARQIRVEEVRVTTPKLPAAVGHVTIAQISDLHLGVMRGGDFLDEVISRLREIKPDILVATGDIVDGQGNDMDALARRLHMFQPPQGAYAIVGNHEYYAGLDHSLRFLRAAGFTVLRGESVAAGGLIIVGMDDPSVPAAKAPPAEIPKGAFVLLLKHQPVVDDAIPFDLQLSGHIHGGQMFPFGLLTKMSYGVGTGLTRLAGGRELYVSRGAGTWGPPFRLLAPPEITLIRIESGNLTTGQGVASVRSVHTP